MFKYIHLMLFHAVNFRDFRHICKIGFTSFIYVGFAFIFFSLSDLFDNLVLHIIKFIFFNQPGQFVWQCKYLL